MRRQLLCLPGAVAVIFVAVLPWSLIAGSPIAAVPIVIPLLPLASTVAILRHGMLYIRLVLARGLSYGLLSGLVLAGYAVLVARTLRRRLRPRGGVARVPAARPAPAERRAVAVRGACPATRRTSAASDIGPQLSTGVASTTLMSLNIRALSTHGPPQVSRKSRSRPSWSYNPWLVTSCG